MSIKVCFLGAARYSRPLDETTEKKFRAISSLGEAFVVGFSLDLRPRRFTEHAHFYLLPQLPLPFLRYVEMFLLGPLVTCWLIFARGIQVLVAQSPYEGFAAAIAKRIAGWLGHRVRLVVENHGDFQESLFLYRRIVLQKIVRFLMRHIANFTLRHADLLRAVSNSTKQQLQRQAPGKTIFQFPTWTDIQIFLQAGINGEKSSSQSILYAGILTPLKGVHHLINAFALIAKDFPRAQLFIVGHEENKSYAAGLREQVKQFDLDERVQFMGAMPQARLATWMGKASVFVLPSASEGLPRVILEAMAARTPVIGSNVGGIPEIVKDGATGFLVQPGDEKGLTNRIRWVFENPDRAREMGHHAHALAERFFSTKAYINGYRQIFDVAQTLAGKCEHAPSTL
jgi:glycosyltransferase involved in cell wall biosynthesis